MLKDEGRRPARLLHTPRTKSAREPNEASCTRNSIAWTVCRGRGACRNEDHVSRELDQESAKSKVEDGLPEREQAVLHMMG